MKKLMVVAAMAMALAAAADGLKIGTIEMMTLVRNHASYEPNKQLLQSTEKDYARKLDKFKEELEAVQDELKSLVEQLRNPMLAAGAKAELEKKGQGLQQKLLSGQQRLRSEAMRSQQELQDLEGRLLKATTEDLRKRIKAFATDNGYDFILDSSAAPFARKEFDVTPQILKAMGVDPAKIKKPGAAKPAAKAGAAK